jgi:hypothetical protein
VETRSPTYAAYPWPLLAVRFAVECFMWAGWYLLGNELIGIPGGILAVILCMVLWGVFGVRGDGVRKDPPVVIPGVPRFALEMILIAIGGWGLWIGWSRTAAETYLTAAIITNALMWERCWWPLRGAPSA